MNSRSLRRVAVWACLLPVPAFAHSGTGLAGGLAAGFSHPWNGLDHLLAMAAVGLWGAFFGRPMVYLLPMIFPAMMVCGAVLGMFGVWLPPVEIGIAASLLMLGVCVAGALRLPTREACLIVAVFAIFHGYAHGQELPSAADPVGYSIGFVFATGLVHLSGIALGMLKYNAAGLRVIRGCGAAIVIVGGCLLVRAVIL
ncbi:MAG: HupE/UreJ family protein [Pseudomonadota bacterium]